MSDWCRAAQHVRGGIEPLVLTGLDSASLESPGVNVGDEEEVFGLKQGLSGELFLKNQTQKKNGKAVASLVFCLSSSGRSLCSSPASSSVRKLLPAAHGLPKNGLCKLIPEGEWQRAPVGRGPA